MVRFIRRLVGLKDEFYNRNILADNHFAPIIDAFLSNRGRYNLLDSAIIDIFEFIQMNQITTLCNYTIENFWKNKLERVDYVKTFRTMKNFYDQQHQIRERLDKYVLIVLKVVCLLINLIFMQHSSVQLASSLSTRSTSAGKGRRHVVQCGGG